MLSVWKEYVFSTCSVFTDEIVSSLTYSLVKIGTHTAELLKALGILLFVVVLMVCKLLVVVFPHMITAVNKIVEFHKKNLSWSDIAIECSFLLLLAAYLTFRKRIQIFWSKTMAAVAAKSQAAARAAPHVLFCVVSLIFSIVGQKFLSNFASPTLLPVFTLVIPFLSTTHAVFLSPTNRYYSFRRLLSQWIILATYHSVVTLLSLVPLSTFVFARTIFIRELVVVMMVWMQLSPMFTEVVLDMTLPVLKSISSKIPSIDMDSSKRSTILSTLTAMGILSSSQASFLGSVLQDGVALLLALLFMFTPLPLLGTVAVALVFPAFKSTQTITGPSSEDFDAATSSSSSGFSIFSSSKKTGSSPSLEQPSSPIGSSTSLALKSLAKKPSGVNKKRDDGARALMDNDSTEKSQLKSESEIDRLRGERLRWLEYWMCFAVLWLLRCYGFVMWSSAITLLTLWLQHSFFLGSAKVISYLCCFSKVVSERNKLIEEHIETCSVEKVPLLEHGDSTPAPKPSSPETKEAIVEYTAASTPTIAIDSAS